MKKGWISAKSPRSAEVTSKTNVVATAVSPPALPPKPKFITQRTLGPDQIEYIPQEPAIAIDPVANVKAFRQDLVNRLEGLGTRPAVYAKAIAEIHSTLAEDYYRNLGNEALATLRALLPKISHKPEQKAQNNAEPGSPDVLSSDDTQSHDRLSGKELEDGSHTTSASSSSPEKEPSAILSSKEPAKVDNIAAEHNNPSQITLVPVSDLFDAATLQAICQEPELSLDHAILAPLHEVIFRLQRLQGDLKHSERLLSPIKRLCDYYLQAREELVYAQSADERHLLLAPEAYAVGDARDYFIIDPGKFATSGEKARNILSRTEEGKLAKENESGNRAGGVHSGAYIKSNPIAGDYLQPATEIAVSTWYQLFSRYLVAAPSANLKVMHAPVNLPEHPDDRLKPMLRNYNGHNYIERVAQCGYLVDGIDFDLVLYALSMVAKWQEAIPKGELQTYLNTFVKINHQDLQLWPEELKMHSGLKEKEYHRLVKLAGVLRKLVPDFTTQNLLKECSSVLNQIDLYSFSALVIANLSIDPSDMKGDNVKLVWDTFPDGSRKYRIVSIDSDQALEFPVSRKQSFLSKEKGTHNRRDCTHSEKGCAECTEVYYQHYPNIKCLLFMMKDQMNHPIDPAFRQEFLSRSAQRWILHWCQLLYQDDNRNRQLINEQAYGAEDLYESHQHEETKANPDAELKRVRRAQAKGKHATEATLVKALDIPLIMHPSRLPDMLYTLERLQAAMTANPNITLMECLRIARPEIALYYENICIPHIKDNDPGTLLEEAYQRVHFSSESYEKFFLKQRINELLKKHEGDKYKEQFDCIKHYAKVLLAQKEANVPEDKRLPSLEELSKQVVFKELNGKSLFDLIGKQNRAENEHRDKASLRVEDAIKLFVNHMDLNQFLPKQIPELLSILNEIGAYFPSLTVSHFNEVDRNDLISRAVESALPGAVTLLSKSFADLNSRNQLRETPLHALMRNHKKHSAEKVLATLEACLRVSTCDPGLFDAEGRTVLMSLIAFADASSNIEALVKALRLGKANINQRAKFAADGNGTALDYAIRLKKPAAVLALLNQGASDLANTAAAVEFALAYQHDNKMKDTIALLQKRNHRFAYEYAVARMSSAHPDEDHPKECKVEGALNGVRYLHKNVWSQLFDSKGDLNRPNGVAAGTHVVIPIKFEGEIITFCKAFPELPGTQYAVDVLHSAFGSLGSPYSELWRCETSSGKKIFPIQMSNAIKGMPLNLVLKDSALRQDLLSKLDPYYLTLLVFIENLIGQEDGHAAQYLVVTIPMPEGERTILVMVDGDHAFVPAFNPYLPGKNKLYIKDIVFLLDQVAKQGLDPRAIETIIKTNAAQLIDRWCEQLNTMEDAHFRLFPRGEENFTLTAPEAMRNPGFARSMLSGVRERLNDKVAQQRDKRMTEEEREVAPVRGGKLGQALKQTVKKALKIQGDYSIIGVSFEQNAIAKLHERFGQTQKVLLHKAIADRFTGMMLLQFTRPALYRAYNAIMIAHPKLDPYEKFEKLTEGLYKHLGKDAEPVTCSSNFDIMVSQEVSTKHQSTGSWITVKAAIQVYNKSKELELAKDAAINEISLGDTTKLQAFPRDDQKEYIVNRLKWDRRNGDNRAIIKTIIQQEISFSELKLINCLALTTGDIEDLLKNSPNLETLNLTGCSGVGGDIVKLLAKYCPDVRTVILSKTKISQVDAMDLPALTHCELSSCLMLKSVKLHAPELKTLRLTECKQLETVELSQQTRDLETLYIEECTELKAGSINAMIEFSPKLAKIRHKNNQPFFARPFAWHAMEQNRYDKNIFLGLLQQGKLNLYGLPFTDEQLREMQEWLTRPGTKLVVNEVDMRGCCYLSRMAILEFWVKLPSIEKVWFQGPLRDESEATSNPLKNGLDGNIVAWHELPSGAIWSAAERTKTKGSKHGSVPYTVQRLELRDPTDLTMWKSDKFTEKVHFLHNGADIKGSDRMTDGSILLSMEDTTSQDYNSYLLRLDPLTNETSFIEVPEVTNFSGIIRVLNNTTFTLQSDQFYIIQKRQFGWQVLHAAPGASNSIPALKGPNNLVVYSFCEDEGSRLTVIDINTGHCVCSKFWNSPVLKAIHFLSRERLLVLVGKEGYYILNIETQRFDNCVLDNDKELQIYFEEESITNPELFHATVGPLCELITSGTNHLNTRNPNTLVCHGTYGRPTVENQIISYLGDMLYVHFVNRQRYELELVRNKFHIIDLNFRNKIQQGYKIETDIEESMIRIICPKNVTPPEMDIYRKHPQINYGRQWIMALLSGQPTDKSLYEVISALFETYAARTEEFFDRRKVSYQDNVISIKGLSVNELRQVPLLLQVLFQIKPEYTPSQSDARFDFSGKQKPSGHIRKKSMETYSDDSDECTEVIAELRW